MASEIKKRWPDADVNPFKEKMIDEEFEKLFSLNFSTSKLVGRISRRRNPPFVPVRSAGYAARLSKNSFAGNDGGIFPLFVSLVM